MAASIKIPAVFTAVDKFSHVVGKMINVTKGFSTTGIAAVKRFDYKVSSVFNKMGRLTQLALGIGLGGLFLDGIDSIKSYETSLASFRTIVSDLSDQEFAGFKKEIKSVAKDTKMSSIDVANSFEKIAGLNAKFAETEKGIGAVSKAAIILSKASGDELGVSAENLVGIMNQFSLGALQADRTINVLAAGQAVGAASITQTSEAFKNFGSVASGSNISLEESVGLIQTLGKFSVFGAEAGTKLRGSVLRLQKSGLGYASGQFSINDALAESAQKMNALSTAKQKDAFLNKLFGAENVSTGRILLANIETYKEFTKGVTGTNEAQKAAEINTNTLGTRLTELKTAWTENIIGASQTGSTLTIVKDVLAFVADNMGTVVQIVGGLIGSFVLMKAVVWGSQAALVAYNIALGVHGALSGVASINIGKNAVALAAYRTAMVLGTASTWLATAATTALGVAFNLGLWPITLIISAIAGLIALFYNWDSVTEWFGNQWDSFTNWIGEAWDSVVKWFQEFDFLDFFKGIGQSILKFLLTPMRMMLQLASSIPGSIGNMAKTALGKIGELTGEIEVKSEPKKPIDSPQINQAKSDESTREAMIKGGLNINLRDPGNVVESTSTDTKDIPINLSKTQGAW